MTSTVRAFDDQLLAELSRRESADVLLLTSDHNVQYLLEGYRPFFFETENTIALSRRLPLLGYVVDRPESSFYLGHFLEGDQLAVEPVWVDDIELTAWCAPTTAEQCARRLQDRGLDRGTIAFEAAFMPVEAYLVLRNLLPDARFVDRAGQIMEDARIVKQPYELERIRRACDGTVAAMQAACGRAYAGITTGELEELMLEEEAARHLHFDYCLLTTGAEGNRAPSTRRRWEHGTALSIDSGGRYEGYLADLARMAVLGEPSSLQHELLAETDALQQAARKAVVPGRPGMEIYVAFEEQLARSPHRDLVHFIAEGVGLVGHEAPRIAPSSPLPNPGEDAGLPLAPGMVLSVETSIHHPTVGLVKLEDQIVVTPDGYEAVGDDARGWNVVG